MRLRAATRGSELALWQTHRISELLASALPGVEVEPVVVSTEGDRDQSSPIAAIGGRGVFAKEVQRAVLDGRADFAVHSAKDLTSTTPDGLVLGAIPERGAVEDGLVGSTLDGLGEGATVATGSVRRRAQLAHLRPDLHFVELRGNMATRLSRLDGDDVDAIVVAAAGLQRLGLGDRIDEILDPSTMLPQVAQGALAVECRDGDSATIDALAAIDDARLAEVVEVERAWLRRLGSGCDLPVGGLATRVGDAIRLEVVLSDHAGTTLIRHEESDPDPVAVVERVADEVLDRRGGRELLDR